MGDKTKHVRRMSNRELSDFAVEVEKHGGIRAASRAMGKSFGYVQVRYAEAALRGCVKPIQRMTRAKPKVEEKPVAGGRPHVTPTKTAPVPTAGVQRYILTCAQNNTHIHEPTMRTLEHMSAQLDARLMISRFTYNHNAFGQLSVKPGTKKSQANLWYDPRIAPYVADERVELAPGLVWCGEVNTLPTAERPLRGFEAYTGRKSGIFPHVKVALDSIPSGKHEGTKLNYTTGTVTQHNYIQKKAGLKAEFHHCYGALMVEVSSDGWWCRQLLANSEGVIHDISTRWHGLDKPSDARIEGLVLGDIHECHMDPVMRKTLPRLIELLQPKHIFYHDLLDFASRNHHVFAKKNWHDLYRVYVRGHDSVQVEMHNAARFLSEVYREAPYDTEHVVVDSNHNNFLLEWLRAGDWQRDPVNAEYFLGLQKKVYAHIRCFPDAPINVMNLALREAGWISSPMFRRIHLLNEDESYILCPDANGGIECGMHGHRGPNGSRGSPQAFARMGRKACTGHTHTAAIVDGVYVAGTSSKLHLDYNSGPSSWTHSHTLVYPTGKRAIITMWNGKWRA